MRVLLTGAAGSIGRAVRGPLRERVDELRVADVRPLAAERENERALVFDLGEAAALAEATAGVDAVVHLAAIPSEAPFEALLEANVRATYHVFEVARLAGVRRVVFASSNHATGFYRRTERVGPGDRPRPDSLYGASKVFGEALGSLYADKFGLEVVALRIGAFGERASDQGPSLPMWISPADTVRLVWAALTAPDVRFEIVYGVSRTEAGWWDDAEAAARLGYEPQDAPGEGAAEDPHGGEPQGFPFTRREYHGDAAAG